MKLVIHSLQKKFVHLGLFGKTAKKKTAQNITKAGVLWLAGTLSSDRCNCYSMIYLLLSQSTISRLFES